MRARGRSGELFIVRVSISTRISIVIILIKTTGMTASFTTGGSPMSSRLFRGRGILSIVMGIRRRRVVTRMRTTGITEMRKFKATYVFGLLLRKAAWYVGWGGRSMHRGVHKVGASVLHSRTGRSSAILLMRKLGMFMPGPSGRRWPLATDILGGTHEFRRL